MYPIEAGEFTLSPTILLRVGSLVLAVSGVGSLTHQWFVCLVCLGQIGGWYHRATYRECFFEYEQVFVNKQPLRERNKILNTAHKRGSKDILSKDMVSQLLHCIYRYIAKKTGCCYKARAIQLVFQKAFLNLHNII